MTKPEKEVHVHDCMKKGKKKTTTKTTKTVLGKNFKRPFAIGE